MRGKYAEAEQLLKEALAVSRWLSAEEEGEVVRQLYILTMLMLDIGDFRQAEQFAREALVLARRSRDDYVPMVRDWVKNGAASAYAQGNAAPNLRRSSDDALAETNFKLGVYFHHAGNSQKADQYWVSAQKLNPDSWNYHRQDWSFTPDEASANWSRKAQSLGDKPYYRPIEGIDD